MSKSTDLNGKLFQIATNVNPPFISLDYEPKDMTWLLSAGAEAKLINELAKHFNFTFKIINCNNDWGRLLPNKTWTGIIGKIFSKEADIGLSSLSINWERSKAVLFTNVHIISPVTFITSRPKPEQNIASVVEPFNALVWICLIFAFILISFNLLLISRYIPETKNINISSVMISTLLRQQTPHVLPSVGSLRIMLCSWILGCLVLTSSYSGCLYSLMTSPSKLKTIDTLMDLAIAQTNGKIQVVAKEAVAFYQLLKKAEFGVHREIGRLIEPVRQNDIEIVINSTKSLAFISSRDHLTDAMFRLGEKLFHLPPQTQESTLYLDIMAIALQKNFQYIKEFNNFVSDMVKGGLFQYWKLVEEKKASKAHQQSFEYSQEVIHDINAISLNQLQTCLYIFVIAQIVSSFIFITELFKFKQMLANSFIRLWTLNSNSIDS